MTYQLQPCTPQVPVGRWLLVHLRPDLPRERANTILTSIRVTFPDVHSVQDLSHTTPEGLSEILAIPDSVIPTDEQLAEMQALRAQRVVQEGLGL